MKLLAVIVCWWVVAGCFSLALFALDKRRAARGRWRISERTLHAVSFAGGWLGALAAMKFLRHKNRKPRFVAVTIGVAALHLALAAVVVFR